MTDILMDIYIHLEDVESMIRRLESRIRPLNYDLSSLGVTPTMLEEGNPQKALDIYNAVAQEAKLALYKRQPSPLLEYLIALDILDEFLGGSIYVPATIKEDEDDYTEGEQEV